MQMLYFDYFLHQMIFLTVLIFQDPIIPMHFALRIYRNGTINYLMRRHLILSCQGRLNIFPFDDPLCSFALESSKLLGPIMHLFPQLMHCLFDSLSS